MSDVQRWTSNSVAPSDAGGFVAYGDYKELRAEVIRQQARSVRMVGLMRKLREPDWHIESIREFQREMTALENAVMSDDSALREMIEAAKAEEREMCAQEAERQSQDEPYGHAKFRCANIAAEIRARNPEKPSGLSERVMTVFAQMQAVSHGRARKG